MQRYMINISTANNGIMFSLNTYIFLDICNFHARYLNQKYKKHILFSMPKKGKINLFSVALNDGGSTYTSFIHLNTNAFLKVLVSHMIMTAPC